MQLRPYQQDCVQQVLEARTRGLQRVLYVLPTGTGKTRVFCELAERLHTPGHPALVIAHREELLGQAWERITHTSPRFTVGMERASLTAPETSDVVVASVQTIGRNNTDRLQWLAEAGPSVIIIDEAHHVAADGYQRVLERFGAYDGRSYAVGCTATAKRMDRKALHGSASATFEEQVFTYAIKDAIADGWLCDIKGYRVTSNLDMSGVRTTAGDYNTKDLARVVNVAARTDRAIEHWSEVASGRRTIVFCVDIQHARDAAEAWNKRGFKAECITGDMPSTERRAALARHKAGVTQVLTNCEVLTEGYDDPDISAIVMLRPTQSWALYVQMVGRGTRIAQGKEYVIVIDVVDNSAKHSLATVPAILDLPPMIDLQGKSLTEAAAKIEDLAAKSAGIKPDSTLSFTDLCTELEKVDLLAVVETPAEIAAVSSFQWLATPGEYYLECGSKRSAHIRWNSLERYYLQLRIAGAVISSAPSFAGNRIEAIARADCFVMKEWPDVGRLSDRNARWRKNPPSDAQVSLLRRFGHPEAIIATITKGQASALIGQKFAKHKQPAAQVAAAAE